MKRQRPEQTLQIGVASWLRCALIAPARFWHVPNGIGTSAVQAGIYKAMGLTTGVHDLHFIWRDTGAPHGSGGRFGTIELKAPGGGGMSDAQVAFGADMAACGHDWDEADSLDSVLDILTAWGVPLRSQSDTVRFAIRQNNKLLMSPTRWGR